MRGSSAGTPKNITSANARLENNGSSRVPRQMLKNECWFQHVMLTLSREKLISVVVYSYGEATLHCQQHFYNLRNKYSQRGKHFSALLQGLKLIMLLLKSHNFQDLFVATVLINELSDLVLQLSARVVVKIHLLDVGSHWFLDAFWVTPQLNDLQQGYNELSLSVCQ